MKLLYLSSVRVPSNKASGLAIARQCEGFVAGGWEVDLHVPERSEQQSISEHYGMNVRFTVYSFASTSRLFTFGKVGFLILSLYENLRAMLFYITHHTRYDVLYSREKLRILIFILMGLRSKCYVEIHQVHDDFITKFVARKAKKVVVISNGLRDYYSKLTDRNDILVEPSGVYLDQFYNIPSKNDLREGLVLPNDAVVYGYIGKFTTIGEDKGVEDIVRAFFELYKIQKNVFLYLVGVEEDERLHYQNIIDKLNLPNSVIRVVELDQSKFAEYVKACDILLMNYPDSTHYAKYMSPIKLFAYLAAGKPIISTDLPTVREITNMQSVLYTMPNDTRDYAEKMLQAYTQLPSLAKEAESNKKLAKRFAWSERGARILS